MMYRYVFAVISMSAFLHMGFPRQLSAGDRDEKLVITAREIRAMNVMKISDLMNRIPGVKAGETSVSIRGSSNVKVLLDGRSINDPTSRSGAVKWSMISLDTIEKIEIFKGSGSISYGDNTSGGVIVITTKSVDRLGGTAGGYFGNNGQRNATLSVQGRKNKLAASLSSGYESYDGFTNNDDKTRHRLGARLDYRFTPDFSLFLSGEYNDEKKGLRGYPERRTPNSRKEYDASSLLMGQKYGALAGRTYYSSSRTISTDPDKDLYASLKVLKAGQTLNVPVVLPLLGGVDGGTGYEWQEASGNNFKTASEERAWFFTAKKLEWQGSAWSFTLGMRANYYSAFRNTLNPELKVGYAKKTYNFEFAASRSNNLPTFRQRYYESSVTKPNPDLRMEKAMNYALSLSVSSDSAWSIDASVFHRDITDRITYVRKPDNTGQYENFGKVTYQGIETSVKWTPSSLIEVSPSYIYLHALNEETGYWLPAKPFHTVLADVIIRPVKGLSLRASAKYTGKVYTRADNSETIPSYTVVDFRADYQYGPVRLYIDIDNLLNEDYLYVDGYDAPPREWFIGMNYNF